MKLEDSVVLITSQDENNKSFGTGFVIRQSSGAAYVLTCAHVLEDVGGASQAKADSMPVKLVKSGESDSLDLAVLRVDGLLNRVPLNAKASGRQSSAIVASGFQKFDGPHMLRQLEGSLGDQVVIQLDTSDRIHAWHLKMGANSLQPGYSGSPIVDSETGCLLGIVSHRQEQGKTGWAISIDALDKIWRIIESEKLYKALLKLGYRKQVKLFRKLIKEYSVAAILIYGSPDYGQRWLLNRLVNHHLPKSITSNKYIRLDLAAKARHSGTKALWGSLASWVSLSRKTPPKEIIKYIYKLWETQNVILVFDNAQALTKELFDELMQDFWLALVAQTHELSIKGDYKLLLFLVDHDGCVGEWSPTFVEKIDTTWEPKLPVRSPKLSEFSGDDLFDWLEIESDELPPEFENEEAIVEEILAESEDGIPELVLQEICERCGCDWYEELQKWLKL
ncbi:MAG: trypsin-like peptidase domain-containing protein [Leptolyngbya sp. SIO1E4]|nr:trypsin-like peptidase domain-containing protein [Leptolyngbya sp. SIO1E4]